MNSNAHGFGDRLPGNTDRFVSAQNSRVNRSLRLFPGTPPSIIRDSAKNWTSKALRGCADYHEIGGRANSDFLALKKSQGNFFVLPIPYAF